MNKLISLFVIILVICTYNSCESDDHAYYTDGLIGHWNWVQTGRPIPLSETNPLTPQKAGYTCSVSFKPDSSWYKMKNNKIIEFGEKFSIGHKEKYDSIAYFKDEKIIATDYFRLFNDTLCFSTSFIGVTSGVEFYKRGASNF